MKTIAETFSTTAHAAETPKTLSSGELKVGMEITYPPFEYYEGDQVKGFDPEVSAALAKRLGLTASFSDITFPNLILGLDANRFDTIISGMYILPERLEKADAIPYAKTGAAIMVRSDAEKKPATPEELCGLTVGLQQGTSWIKALQEVSDGYCKEQNAGAIAHEGVSADGAAMQCASLLREAMWSMVSELHLNAPGADYVAYTAENLERLDAALDLHRTRYGKTFS